MPSPSTVTIRRGDTIVIVGDSLVEIGSYVPLQDSVTRAFAVPAPNYPGYATVLAGQAAVRVAPPYVSPPGPPASPVTWVNSGVSGNRLFNIAADVPGRITQYNPTVVIIACEINDVINGFRTDLQSQTDLTTIITQTRAAIPSVRLLFVAALTHGELWTTGPVGNNADDALIDSKTAALQTTCDTLSVCFANPRATLWQWEQANNLSNVASGPSILTSDGIHPNDNGKLWLSAVAFSKIAFA
jgi:lysophospholipase L1-like esterase